MTIKESVNEQAVLMDKYISDAVAIEREACAEVADRYFESRPRGSQISAWVATQSDTIPAQEFMDEKVKELTRKFHDKPVPRPDSWLGYRVKPHRYEFWQGQENRLHDRIVYQSDNSVDWSINRLAP